MGSLTLRHGRLRPRRGVDSSSMPRTLQTRIFGWLLRTAMLLMSSLALCAHAAGDAAAGAAAGRAPIVVFAAASLTDALQDVTAQAERLLGVTVKLSFAASSALARQIDNGAPADVFVSADTDWMDYLQTHARIEPGSRVDLLGNRLVLVAPAGSDARLKIGRDFPLAAALAGGRLAVGDPDAVPAGRYARAALTQLGVWDSVSGRLVRAENVRAALALVDRGEVPLGIVYRTDALIDKGVRIVDTFPAGSHPPIVYPVALLVGAKAGARDYLEYLRTPAATAVFSKYGFEPVRR